MLKHLWTVCSSVSSMAATTSHDSLGHKFCTRPGINLRSAGPLWRCRPRLHQCNHMTVVQKYLRQRFKVMASLRRHRSLQRCWRVPGCRVWLCSTSSDVACKDNSLGTTGFWYFRPQRSISVFMFQTWKPEILSHGEHYRGPHPSLFLSYPTSCHLLHQFFDYTL